MEPIHFYNNGSPKHHKAVSRWFFMSCLLLASSIMSLASMQLLQWYTHSSLITEKNIAAAELRKFDHIAHHQQSQKALQITLEKKTEQLQRHNKNQKNPADLLKTLKAALKNDANLESVSCTEKNIELKISGEKTKTLVHCAEFIAKKSSYADLCITALECKEKNRIVAIIKGEQENKKM